MGVRSLKQLVTDNVWRPNRSYDEAETMRLLTKAIRSCRCDQQWLQTQQGGIIGEWPLFETMCCWCGVARINRFRDQSFPHGKLRHGHFLASDITHRIIPALTPNTQSRSITTAIAAPTGFANSALLTLPAPCSGRLPQPTHRLAVHEPTKDHPTPTPSRPRPPPLPRPRNHGSRPQENHQHCASQADR